MADIQNYLIKLPPNNIAITGVNKFISVQDEIRKHSKEIQNVDILKQEGNFTGFFLESRYFFIIVHWS